jgi:hypothetical protein
MSEVELTTLHSQGENCLKRSTKMSSTCPPLWLQVNQTLRIYSNISIQVLIQICEEEMLSHRSHSSQIHL